jgi:hypothetical protein
LICRRRRLSFGLKPSSTTKSNRDDRVVPARRRHSQAAARHRRRRLIDRFINLSARSLTTPPCQIRLAPPVRTGCRASEAGRRRHAHAPDIRRQASGQHLLSQSICAPTQRAPPRRRLTYLGPAGTRPARRRPAAQASGQRNAIARFTWTYLENRISFLNRRRSI